GAAEGARARVVAAGDLRHGGAVLREDRTAGPGRRGDGGRGPGPLLIRDSREQPPDDARRALGLEGDVRRAGPPRAHAAPGRARADVVELARREVVAIEDLLQLAGRLALREIRRDALAQFVAALRQGPR